MLDCGLFFPTTMKTQTGDSGLFTAISLVPRLLPSTLSDTQNDLLHTLSYSKAFISIKPYNSNDSDLPMGGEGGESQQVLSE